MGSEISSWQSQPQGMHDSALKETGFKNQSVSTTNLLDSNIKERVQAGKDPSLSPSFLLEFSLAVRELRSLGKKEGIVYVNY